MSIARLLPSSVRPVDTYEEFVCVSLNLEYLRVANIVDMADAVEIGVGKARIPDEWIRLLSSTNEERGKWLMREIRKELFG